MSDTIYTSKTLQRFIDFVNSSKIHEVNTLVFYGYEIEELKKFLKEHQRLQEFKAIFDNYELAKKRGFIAYENWQECEKELGELKHDVKRYFALEKRLKYISEYANTTREIENMKRAYRETLKELHELEEKLLKVNKEK